MSLIQLIIIVVMACFAGIIIMGAAGFVFYNSFLGNQPIPIQVIVPVLPTLTRTQPAKISLQTVTSQPTLTRVPTATKLPTETIMPSPTLWFQVNAGDFIPVERDMPSDYKIYTPSSGMVSDEYGNSATIVYNSDYPSYNQTEEPYLVAYKAYIFNNVDFATSSYDGMDEDYISSNWGKWFNSSETISPSQVEFNINGIERAAAYISDYNGESVHGFFVFIKLQSHNGVFMIRTLSHAPSNDRQKALASAKYFASLLALKIVR